MKKNYLLGIIVALLLLNISLVSADVFINEILPNVGTIDWDNGGSVSESNDEWVELYNNDTVQVDISGWTITDKDQVRYTFPASTIIEANNYIIAFDLSLVNGNDNVSLFDDSSVMIDTYNWSSDPENDVSIGRIHDGLNTFITFTTPTFNATNNRAPTGTIPKQTIQEDTDSYFNVSDFITDSDDDSLTYNIVGEDTSEVDCTVVDETNITFSPAPNFNGLANCTIDINDSYSLTNNTFLINVTSVNDVPLAENFSVLMVEDTNSSMDLELVCMDEEKEIIRIKEKGSHEYVLQFKDADGNYAQFPLTYANSDTELKMGDDNDNLVLSETTVISKNDYFIVSDYSKEEGKRTTYALRYKGADKVAPGEIAIVKFDYLGTGNRIEHTYDPVTGATLKLKLGGSSFNVIAASDDTFDDFDIIIDLNANGNILDSNPISLNTWGGSKIEITNTSNNVFVNISVSDNGASVITPIDNHYNMFDDSISYNITPTTSSVLSIEQEEDPVTGSDQDPLTYEIVSNPTYGVLSVNTNLVNYTPNMDYNGSDSFTYKCNDGNLDSNTATVSITVLPLNDEPVLDAITNKTTVQEQEISFTISGSDVDGDDLTYTMSPVLGKLNDTTGVFEWTPDHTFYGDNLVTFTVSDGNGLTDNQEINIDVDSTLNISDVNVNSADVEDEEIVQDVKPGDIITTTIDVKNIGSVNLDDVEVNLESIDFIIDELVDLDVVGVRTTETATFSFTVPYDTVEGIYDIDLDVIGDDHDDGDSRYSSFTYSVNVTKALDEIVISSIELGNDTIKCLDQTNITINVSNIGDLDQYDVNVTVTNNALNLAKHNDAEDVDQLETETYFFTIDTLGYAAGTYDISIEAEYYNGAKVTSSAVLTIENCEPAFSGPITGVSILEDTYDDTIDLTAYFNDKNNDTLTYGVNGNLTSLNFNDFSSTGLVNITPDADYVGINDINFTASDANGIAFSGDVTITVTNVNDEPILSAIGDKTATQGTEFTYQVTATDVDAGDVLTYTLTPLNGTTLAINQSGYIDSWTADIADVGEVYGINVEVCDDSGALDDCANETFNILVNNANDAPTLTAIGPQSINEDDELQFDLYGADNDLNTVAGDTLTYACNLTSLTVDKIDNTQANVTWTPVASDVGEYTVNCTITDVAGANGYSVFDLTVNEVNDTPIIQPMQSQQIPALELFTLQVVAADEESDDITYSITSVVVGNMIIDPVTGALTWTPIDSEVGTHTVTVGASDGNSMDEENVTLTVFKGILVKSIYLVDDGVDISLTDNGQTSNVLPGSVLGLKLTLENKFTDYTLYDIAVDATVDSLSDGETAYTLAPGATTTIELSLGTLSNTASGDFVLDIIVDGDYDNGVVSAAFNNTVTVESTRYMLIIQNPALSEDNLSCNRDTILSTDVLNIGSRLQDETVTLNVANSGLGLNQNSDSQVIAYNTDKSFNLDISIPHSQASATYPLTITATSERGTVSDPVTVNLIVSDCAVTLSPSSNNIVIGEDETKLFSIDGLSNLAANPVVVWTKEDGSQLTEVSYPFTPASFTGNERSYDIGVEINDDNGFSLTNTWLITVTKIPYTTTYTTTPALSTFNETTIQNVTDFTIARNGYGSVQFKGPLDLSGCVDLDSVFYMDRGIIAIDSAACPALDEENVLVTLKGLTLTGNPRIKYKGTFTKDANYVNIACTTCNPTSPSDGVVIFTAAYGFSSYKVDTVIPTNSAVANAGSNQNVAVNTLVTLSGSASTGDAPLSYSWTAPSGITLSSTSIANPTFTPTTVGTYTFTLTASNSYGSSSDSVVITVNDGATSGASGNLTISDLDIKVGDKSEKDVRNGETIGRDAKPGDKVKFDIEVSNLFPKSSDIDMEDIEITVTIKDIDDGGDDDLEEEETIDDLDAGDEDSIILEFDIPILVEEEDYDVVIEVTGEDDNGVDHDVRWELKLTVEKEKHDLIIDDADLTPSLIRCNRNPALSIDVVNIGTEDEDDVSIEITSDELGIDVEQRDIELEEGDDDDSIFEKTYRFKIDNSVDAGTYPITINVEYDGKSGDEKTLDLVIEDCVEIVTPLESDELDIVDLITTTASTQPVKPASTTISFTETSEYLTLLVILFVLLAGGVIFLIGATIILINKR